MLSYNNTFKVAATLTLGYVVYLETLLLLYTFTHVDKKASSRPTARRQLLVLKPCNEMIKTIIVYRPIG